MARMKRKFSPQFKAEAAQFVIETGRPTAEIARELEINEGTLGNWVNEWKQSNPEPEKALTPVERARVAEMEDEIRRLWMENEFLDNAAAETFFATKARARFAVAEYIEVFYNRAHALIDRLPHPRASPQRLPQRRTRSLMTRRNQSRDCPESLTRIS